MSYILDALRRADAERERGSVPSIHAQQFALQPGDEEPAARSRAPLWISVGLAIALLGALAWNFLRTEPPRTIAVTPAPVIAAPPVAVAPTAPPVVAASAPPLTASVAAAPKADASARHPVRRVAAAAPASAATRGAPAPDARRPGTEPEPARIYAQRELPEAVRRELPAVTVGGSTYSTNSASRMLMINGQIFHEGDSVARGVVLQQIKPRSAVLEFKGYRYEMTF